MMSQTLIITGSQGAQEVPGIQPWSCLWAYLRADGFFNRLGFL